MRFQHSLQNVYNWDEHPQESNWSRLRKPVAEVVATIRLSLGMIFKSDGWVKRLQLPQPWFKCMVASSIWTWYLWIAACVVLLSSGGGNLNHASFLFWKSSTKETGSIGLWIGSTVGMSGLKEDGSSLSHDKATEKGSTVDDNGVGCDKPTEKGLTVDNDGVRSTGLGRSGLGGIGSNLRREGRSQRRWDTSKGSPARFCVESSILLWRCGILFFLKPFFNFFLKY